MTPTPQPAGNDKRAAQSLGQLPGAPTTGEPVRQLGQPASSHKFGQTTKLEDTPRPAVPADGEQIRQIKELVRQYDNRSYQIEPGDKKIHTSDELAKRIVALFAAQAAAAQERAELDGRATENELWTRATQHIRKQFEDMYKTAPKTAGAGILAIEAMVEQYKKLAAHPKQQDGGEDGK